MPVAHRHLILVAIALAACGRARFDPRDDAPAADTRTDTRMVDAAFGPPPGHALSLDGAGYMTADSLCASVPVTMTASAWIYPLAGQPPGNPMVVAFNNVLAANPENLSLMIWDPTLMHLNYYDDVEANLIYYGGPPALAPEQWIFMAFTIDGAGNGITYQNGIAIQTFTTTRTVPITGRFSVGQEWDTGAVTDTYAGLIDEVRVWNVVRSPSEILDDMANSPVVGNLNLVADFTFENGGTDASGNGHTGTLFGTATVVSTP